MKKLIPVVVVSLLSVTLCTEAAYAQSCSASLQSQLNMCQTDPQVSEPGWLEMCVEVALANFEHCLKERHRIFIENELILDSGPVFGDE